MHRTGPILLAAAALLTGCSPGSSTPATVTVSSPAPAAATAPAESPASTDSDIFASQFHPCEVFTEEQFAEAGLGKHLNNTDNPVSNVRTCGFSPIDLGAFEGSFLVATDRLNRDEIEIQKLRTLEWPESEIEGIYVHQMPSQIRQCTAAVDVEWGRFLVGYRELGQGWEPELLCSASVAILESLISQIGGINAGQAR